MKSLPNWLLTLLAALLLVGLAFATPWPSLTTQALEAHMELAPQEDDPYAFLFE